MTMVTRCDVCGAERQVEGRGGSVDGWASVSVVSPPVGRGRRGASEHLDLCPVCATDLRVWVGSRIAAAAGGTA